MGMYSCLICGFCFCTSSYAVVADHSLLLFLTWICFALFTNIYALESNNLLFLLLLLLPVTSTPAPILLVVVLYVYVIICVYMWLSYIVWCVEKVHVLNFSFVPLHRRLLVQNTLTIGWAAYLSHCDEEFEQEEKQAAKQRNEKQATSTAAVATTPPSLPSWYDTTV